MIPVGRNTRVYASRNQYFGFEEVTKIRSAVQENTAEEIDTTSFGDERRTSVAGFPGGNVTLAGYWNVEEDPLGQGLLREAQSDQSDIWVKVLRDGENGVLYKVRVKDFTEDTAVDTVTNLNIVLLPQAKGINIPS